MTTQIATGSPLARKVFSAALFAAQQRKPTLSGNLTGPAPKQAAAEAKLKGQSSPDMPIVEIKSLENEAGDKVSVDLFNIIGGKPIMGDRKAEGRGSPLTSNTFEMKINQYRKPVSCGGEMTRKRTPHQLRGIGMATLLSYFPRLRDQLNLVHMAGARGTQEGLDWVVPLSTDADYAEILVNPVQAPTYNRHFVADSTNIVQGGAQLAAIDSTDLFKLEHLDALRAWYDDLEFPMQPVKIADDPAAEDEPLLIFLASPRMYSSLLTNTSGAVLRTFQQNAITRASYGSKHPLFRGDVGMWNGILVKKMTRSIRFTAGLAVPHITIANEATATETNVTVNAGLGAGFAVDRGILLGAQALACAYGKHHKSGFYYDWSEKWLDHDNELELLGAAMAGHAKVRFSIPNAAGTAIPTDHGIAVLDAAVKL
jgi:N4-gp56 family major capsid protein